MLDGHQNFVQKWLIEIPFWFGCLCRSSVTRMSVDQKQSVPLKNLGEEGVALLHKRLDEKNEKEEKLSTSSADDTSSDSETGICKKVQLNHGSYRSLKYLMLVLLVVFYILLTARSFRDSAPIYCPLRRTWSSVNTPFSLGI